MADRVEQHVLDGVFVRAARVDAVNAANAADAVRAYPRSDGMPASSAQRRLCFLEALNGPNATYNVPFFLRLDGPLDVPALWGALDDVVARHEALRTTFTVQDDDVRQVVHPPTPVPRLYRAVAGEEAAQARLQEATRVPFDLHSGEPLLRTALVRAADAVHLLLVNLHHAVTDGWSEAILFDEIGACYTARVTGTSADLAPLTVQYPDYAAWEAEPDTMRLYDRQLAHWREQLADLPQQTGIPTDRPRPELLSGSGASIPVDVPRDLGLKVREHRASLFEVAVTALAALLHRYNGEDRIVVGAPVANRPRPEWEPVVGYFANSLAVPVDVSGNPALGELLARVRMAAAAALSHQNVPFDRVVDALGVLRHSGLNPVFQVMCSVNRVTRAPALPGLVTSLVEARNDTAKFDLELAVVFDGDRVEVAFDYADDLFERATIEQLATDYRAMLDELLSVPATPVGAVRLATHAAVSLGGRPVELRDQYGNRVPTGVYGTVADGRRARVRRDGALEIGHETAPLPNHPPEGDDRPLTPTESALAGIWAKVLGRPISGRHGDFFAVGGDSLLATRVVAQTRRVWPVKPTVRDMLTHRTIGALAAFIDEQMSTGAAAECTPSVVAARSDPAPLSLAQRGMWIVNQLEGHGGYYHMPLAVRLRGQLDVPALAEAVTDLCRRHESLRTVFPDEAGEPRQSVCPVPEVSVNLSVTAVTSDELKRELERAAAQPFDLRTTIPLSASLFRLGPQEHALLVVVHHIASDGLSWAPLCRDLERAYACRSAGRAPDWAPLPVQFSDFARGQQIGLGAANDPLSAHGRSLAYWRSRLAGLPEETPLPRDRPRPAVPEHRVWRAPIEFGPDAQQRVAQLAGRTGTSAFMVVQAALVALLTRMGVGCDIALGSPVAGRSDPEYDDLVGCFVNTVVLRTNASGDPSFCELLDRVRETTLDAHEHGDLPFDRLVQELNPPRVPGRNPLFQVMFTLNNGPEPTLQLKGLDCSWLDIPTAAPPFDLSVELTEDHVRNVITGQLTADAQMFDQATAGSLVDRFALLLDAVLNEPDRRMSGLDVLTPAERVLVLDSWARPGGGATPVPLPDLLRAAAVAAPVAAALEAGDERVTYAELDTRVDALAATLAHRGVGSEDLVALALPRGIDLVTAVLAVGRAGAAFLPLDLTHPAERIAFTLTDASPALVLSTSDTIADLDVDGLPTLLLDQAELRTSTRLQAPDPMSAAYVMYTSGSTGQPKGVVVTHAGLASLADHLHDLFGAGPDSRILHLTSSTFDVSVAELLLWLASRGVLVIAPPYPVAGAELAALLADRAVTHAMLTPTGLSALPLHDLPDLAGLVVAGEPLSTELARRWAPGRVLVNGYGPTEATVLATTAVVTADVAPNIGRPVPGMGCLVLDDTLSPVPPGVPGELYLVGAALARGYLKRAALTAERFLPVAGGDRMYRTGDVVRWSADGELQYLGRNDDQVKIRGVRIELGEVEAVLRTHPAVGDVVVTVDRPGRPDARLIAYVRRRDARSADLRAHAARTLPRHLVPAVVIELDALPTLPSGKVDKAALPAPPEVAAARVPPSTPTEKALAEVWRSLFDGGEVGARDNFFALGGHSLSAIQMLGAIRASLGVTLPLSKCFEMPTIAELAAYIDAASTATSDDPPVVRRRTR